MIDTDKTIELVASSFELMQGKLDDRGWAKKLAAACNAESGLCIRWTRGKPEKYVCTSHGYKDNFATGWSNWADHITELYKPQETALIDDMLADIDRAELIQANPDTDPQLLVGIVDWSPALIFIAIHRDPQLGVWSEEEREHFREVCRLTRRSALLHKHHAQTFMMATTTIDILNHSPRGIISLDLQGGIHFVNTAAQKLMAANESISPRDGKLHFKDRIAQADLEEVLKTTAILNPKQLESGNPAAYFNSSVENNSGDHGYQLLYQAITVSSWSVESSPHDRIIILYVYDPDVRLAPKAKSLQRYYNLTQSQANVAVEMYKQNSIKSVAQELDISLNTARTHLRAIYAKTGVSSQSQLMSLLTSTIKTVDNPQSDSQ